MTRVHQKGRTDMTRTHDGVQQQVLHPDADIEDADWPKYSWDYPPYKSREFFDSIGGDEALDEFRKLPAYKMAVNRGLIHDDEWVLDWCEPDFGGDEPLEPGSGRHVHKPVHVHIHR